MKKTLITLVALFGFSLTYGQMTMEDCNQESNCCQDVVNNTVLTLSMWMDGDEYFFSDEQLMDFGNGGYAICMGYEIEGWD